MLRELIAMPFRVIAVTLLLMSIVVVLFTAFIRGGIKNLKLSFSRIDKWFDNHSE